MRDIPLSPAHRALPRNIYRKDRIEQAFQILDGIPADAFALDAFCTQALRMDGDKVAPTVCGTIACGGGWLALHPTFQEYGLFMPGVVHPNRSVSGSGVRLRSNPVLGSFEALALVFGHPDTRTYAGHVAKPLFSADRSGGWDTYLKGTLGYGAILTEKDLLLARLKYAHQHFSA